MLDAFDYGVVRDVPFLMAMRKLEYLLVPILAVLSVLSQSPRHTSIHLIVGLDVVKSWNPHCSTEIP